VEVTGQVRRQTLMNESIGAGVGMEAHQSNSPSILNPDSYCPIHLT